ncbi:iron-sulfur cluster carrier protein [Thalassotalea insulae]|uniref:Iron-sulfur cluster carrier protein n=1 Tax=Thalassotalea insulae TaxID=2056778 RepID=A0ABQ6GXT8_9GAMM|nr:iron-sulfur cluster carrier protein ApbC [Thalassotalea insulae]GLX80152.1 iron-sulfur cluster carrier protein [Thalassotalea insulae]
MFSKFFSKKSIAKEQIEAIEQFYQSYRSDIFPEGIANVCQLRDLEIVDGNITLSLTVPFACESELDCFAEQLLSEQQVSIIVDGRLDVLNIKKHDITGIKNIIAIASGKGGVGKSTTAVNLAYAMQAEGARVGILDADIYGPSIPKMLGKEDVKVTSRDGKLMDPIEVNELAAMSIGFLVDEKDATIWRGPMASRAFGQLLNETAWQDIDYLIVDLPPGTGDIQLTLAQQVPVAAAVVITTPQDIALADAAKGIAMFNKVNVPVLGVIENMSYHLCQNCGEKSHLFGQGGGELLSKDYGTQLLGQLPLDISICQHADQGKSALVENSAGDIAQQYRRIAGKIAADLFRQFDARSPATNEILIKQVD